jgi:abortive infection bacteriophage resistance protein
MQYTKPHLPFSGQIPHLESVGLACSDPDEANQALQDVGYYRLAAYTYPFRRLLTESEPRETAFQYRADEYVVGADISDAIRLYNFDKKLRQIVFDGVATLEIALRVQIAHVLGARDQFGQTNRAFLDKTACSSASPPRSTHEDMFSFWLADYDKLTGRASSEDFMQHFNAKYAGELPTWMAVQTFDFGGLTRLFSLLTKYDQNLIASRFGVSNGSIFHKWLLGVGGVRNHCAHHNRLWNRQMTHALASIAPTAVGEPLHHLSAVGQRKKLYVWLSVLGYSLRTYDDTSNWFRTIGTHIKKFPPIAGLSARDDMGFPNAWQEEALWKLPPAEKRTLPS